MARRYVTFPDDRLAAWAEAYEPHSMTLGEYLNWAADTALDLLPDPPRPDLEQRPPDPDELEQAAQRTRDANLERLSRAFKDSQ